MNKPTPETQADLAPEACRPADLRIDREEGLTIKWLDGTTSRYPLAYLRKHCPCASCRQEAERRNPPQAAKTESNLSLNVLPKGIDHAAEFVDAKLVGNYALNITWADGHTSGIYEFRYLRTITPNT